MPPQTVPMMACMPFENHTFCMAPLWLSIVNAATSRMMKIAALIKPYMILPLRKVLSHKECVVVCVLERQTSTARNRSERVVCNVERNVHLL